jgi:hypothetical protein
MPRRGLNSFEIEQAQLVFASTLDNASIVLHEHVAWPDRIAAIGARLRGDPKPSHNAVTLGNHIYFPIKLETTANIETQLSLRHMAWLIHELTHCWQFQHEGISYFFKALWAQIRFGSDAYAYGWKSGLERAFNAGEAFSDFNPEQQGEIARHFYYRLKQDLDTSAWRPWILAIQATGTDLS